MKQAKWGRLLLTAALMATTGAAMAADKVDALEETGAEVLVSADCGCLANLNGTLEKRGSRLRGQHIATFLWQHTGGGV